MPKINKVYLRRPIPSEYQAVEYIESTGTQKIDTGVTVKSSGRVFKIKHSKLVNPGSTGTSIFGVLTPGEDTVHTRYSMIERQIEWDCYRGNGYGRITYTLPSERDILELELGNNYIKDLSNGTTLNTGTVGDYSSSNTIPLFGRYVTSSSTFAYSSFKLYYFQIIDDGKLVRDFIPCYRKSDNVIGLYDNVTGIFFTNSGTGTFTKGADVNTLREVLIYPTVKHKIYDFTTQNILTFQWQGDNSFPYGYTAGSGYYTVKNSYYQGQTLWTLPSDAYVNGVKKITITGSLQSAICCFALVNGNGFNNSTMIGIRGWVSSGGPSAGNITTIKGDGSSQEILFSSGITYPTGNVEFIVDLEKQTFIMKNTNGSYIIGQLSSGFSSAFKSARANGNVRIGITNGNYNAGSNDYYTYMKKIDIEY